ncbi:MAG: hypothetical protein ACRECT_05815 [Thermoplasmata archaeon]
MRSPNPYLVAVEFDAFRVAVGLALIAGGLSLVASYLDALTLTLTALAAAGWAAAHASERAAGTAGLGVGERLGLASAVAGAALYFLLPPPLSVVRGLLLAASLLPLWWAGRPHRAPWARRTEGAP